MFIASPKVRYNEVVELGYEENISWNGAADKRGMHSWAQARVWMMSATDGQYAISCGFGTGICTDADRQRDIIPWLGAYDVAYLDNGTAPCADGGANLALGLGGYYIAVDEGYWKGDAACGPNGPPSVQDVGRTLVHEWGHYEFDITPDEYDTSSRTECSHSLMAGGWSSSCLSMVGFCHFEFCSAHNHFIDPESGASGTIPIFDNWWHLDDEYSALDGPSSGLTPDFSQLRTLHERINTYTRIL